MAKGEVDIVEGLAEFFALADGLDMPESERRGILGVSHDGWHALTAARVDSAVLMRPEFRRRLDYVLPLMRTSLANQKQAGGNGSGEARPPHQMLS